MLEDILSMLENCTPFLSVLAVLSMLGAIARSLGTPKQKELIPISIFCIILFIPGCIQGNKNWEANKMRTANIKSQEDYYYNILEIEVGSSKDEIRQAYDRLHSKYTLDSIRHGQWSFLGGVSNSIEERKANRALEDIEEAYKELMKKID